MQMVTKKTHLLALVAVAAILAFGVSPITTAFAQESIQITQTYSEDKTYGEGEGKSCPGGKDKGDMSA